MARKWSEQELVESYAGTWRATAFYKSLSDDAYVGFVTASALRDYPRSGLNALEMYALVKRLLNDGKFA